MNSARDEITVGDFWRTLGERAIGATVVTADSAEGPRGFLGLSAAHVSADPPRMLVSIDRKTSALDGVLEQRHFAINILPEGQAALASAFGGKGEKPFAPEEWTTLATGAPVFAAALGVFDCEVEQVVDLDGTAVVIGRVRAVRAAGEGEPLVFFRGKFLSD
ncbi:flavin reductase family protein [Salipiger mucosus]|uniref:Putative HPA reductase n=1 Tax=Salipiger mucosus DSM 16094 TaxID=1123237 RepID=S9REU3_9RHOB|nr:flavin reductase family protein [Salipiger mucosus]EPX76625.1 putative HPA reductase [Salipiger mucosus DSM 16094]